MCVVTIIKSSRTALPLWALERRLSFASSSFLVVPGHPNLPLSLQLAPISYCSASLTKLHIMNLEESKHLL